MTAEIEFPSIYNDGLKHGEEIWRPIARDIVIENPYPGSTPEGSSFYLGVVDGLQKASIGHHLQ